MNCEELTLVFQDLLIDGRDLLGRPDVAEHLKECPSCKWQCARALETLEAITPSRQVSASAELKQRIVSGFSEYAPLRDPGKIPTAFNSVPVPMIQFRKSNGRLSMKQRFAFSGLALAAAILLAAWLSLLGRPLSAMEQIAATVREAKSYMFEIVMDSGAAGKKIKTKVFWMAPGSVRMEDYADGEPTEVKVFPHRQPGIRIDPKRQSFMRMPAQLGAVSPLLLVMKLGDFHGRADRQLGKKQINRLAVEGFEIAVTKVDPGVPAGKLEIWVDAATKLPVLMEAEIPESGAKTKLRFVDFQWDLPLDEKLFDPTPPANYADNTPQPPKIEEQTELIAAGLELYAELFGGHYPRVKMVYGDVTMREVGKKLGIDERPTAEQIKSDNYGRYLRAIGGFAWVNTILRENADAAYYGKTVGAKDKDDVLLRWKLDDGRYRVIYGDRRAEIVSSEQLKKLEGK